ncbi:MAG: hypothetical protein KAH32_09210, partial [Chlamydiia bacterium]|nr:hypothetical protein [Chlamydiia bacterium]
MPLMRQGAAFGMSHPIRLAKIVARQFKTGFSEESEMRSWAKIEESPYFMNAYNAGIDFYDINSVAFEDKPEFFRSRILDSKYTLKGLGYGVVKGVSERWFVSYINDVAMTKFENYMLSNPHATVEDQIREAKYINAGIGKGMFGKYRVLAKPLAYVGFAPKYELSKWQLPYYMAKYMKVKSIRKEILRDLAGFVISRLLFSKVIWGMWLISLMGGDEPEKDVRKADYGKQVVGNIHADDWGAYLQIYRMFRRLIKTGDFDSITEKEQSSFMDIFERYLRYRMNPNISLGLALYTGKSIVGYDITRTKALQESFSMMAIRDITEMIQDKESGTLADIFFGVKAMIGGNVQVYEDRSKS